MRKELRRKRIRVHLVSRVGNRMSPVPPRLPIVIPGEDVNGDVDDQYLRLLILLLLPPLLLLISFKLFYRYLLRLHKVLEALSTNSTKPFFQTIPIILMLLGCSVLDEKCNITCKLYMFVRVYKKHIVDIIFLHHFKFYFISNIFKGKFCVNLKMDVE